jgi:hypothetical protein
LAFLVVVLDLGIKVALVVEVALMVEVALLLVRAVPMVVEKIP